MLAKQAELGVEVAEIPSMFSVRLGGPLYLVISVGRVVAVGFL